MKILTNLLTLLSFIAALFGLSYAAGILDLQWGVDSNGDKISTDIGVFLVISSIYIARLTYLILSPPSNVTELRSEHKLFIGLILFTAIEPIYRSIIKIQENHTLSDFHIVLVCSYILAVTFFGLSFFKTQPVSDKGLASKNIKPSNNPSTDESPKNSPNIVELPKVVTPQTTHPVTMTIDQPLEIPCTLKVSEHEKVSIDALNKLIDITGAKQVNTPFVAKGEQSALLGSTQPSKTKASKKKKSKKKAHKPNPNKVNKHLKTPTTIYMIQTPFEAENGKVLVKIGESTNMAQRVKTFRFYWRDKFRVLIAVKGIVENEGELHRTLISFHEGGEYFALDTHYLPKKHGIRSFADIIGWANEYAKAPKENAPFI
jgi:hypothetical protein